MFRFGRFSKNYYIQLKVPLYSLTAHGPDKFSNHSEGEITSKYVVKVPSVLN